MKFSAILTALTATIATVAGYETSGKPHTVDILIDYSIKETPEISQTDVANWVNGQKYTLEYVVNNNEETEIAVVGVTGQFKNPVTNQIVTNLTTGQVGPITVAPGESIKFEQIVDVDLIPDNYELIPHVFVAHDDLIKVIPCRGQLASIVDAAVSFFDPRLIFLELVLLATFGGIAYFVYEIWGKQYLRGTAPVKVPVKKSGSPVAVKEASPVGSASGFDESWIPEAHLKKNKKKA